VIDLNSVELFKKELTKRSYFHFVCLAFFIIMLNGCSKHSDDIELAIRQWQTPVLKLKRDNVVARVKLVVPADKFELQAQSVNVDFSGCDDIKDIAAARLYYTGSDTIFSAQNNLPLFGREHIPSTKTTFKGEQKTPVGEHNFWLSLELTKNANLHHKVAASISSIAFSDGTTITPLQKAPALRQRIGVAVRQHMQDDVHTYRIPGLSTTNDGTLLAVYDARRESSRDLQGDMDIGLSRSTDGGNSWEPMRLALDMGEHGGLPQKFNGVSDACILVDKNSNSIFVAGLWMHGVLDENGQWIKGLTNESTAWEHQWRQKGSQPGFGINQTSQFLISKSTDDGVTWSNPVNLTRMCKKEDWWLWAPGPGRGITLKDGTLVLPTQGRNERGRAFSNITYSKDGGQTWTTSSPASLNTTECQVVQLNDGELMLNIRDNRNRKDDSENNGRSIFTTADFGATWTEHPTSRNALIESTCMASLHKHVYMEKGQKKSILLFSNPNTKKGRHHTTIKVSFDDGETWPEKQWLLLDEGDNRGYSCLTSLNEQTIGILYEGSQADMTFENIPLNELIRD
jgi:sialidase-1